MLRLRIPIGFFGRGVGIDRKKVNYFKKKIEFMDNFIGVDVASIIRTQFTE